MRTRFPSASAAEAEWVNLPGAHGRPMESRTRAVLLQPFAACGITRVLVEVRRKVADEMPLGEAVDHLRRHVSHGRIRIADRAFTRFADIAMNGVGRHWREAMDDHRPPPVA